LCAVPPLTLFPLVRLWYLGPFPLCFFRSLTGEGFTTCPTRISQGAFCPLPFCGSPETRLRRFYLHRCRSVSRMISTRKTLLPMWTDIFDFFPLKLASAILLRPPPKAVFFAPVHNVILGIERTISLFFFPFPVPSGRQCFPFLPPRALEVTLQTQGVFGFRQAFGLSKFFLYVLFPFGTFCFPPVPAFCSTCPQRGYYFFFSRC